MDFPTANQARQLLIQSNKYFLDIALNEIKSMITEARKSFVDYTLEGDIYKINSQIISFLIDKGYSVELVEPNCQRDMFTPYLSIRWD